MRIDGSEISGKSTVLRLLTPLVNEELAEPGFPWNVGFGRLLGSLLASEPRFARPPRPPAPASPPKPPIGLSMKLQSCGLATPGPPPTSTRSPKFSLTFPSPFALWTRSTRR